MNDGNNRKFFELLAVFPFFLTPLLLFMPAHDEFELPKLTLLMLVAVPAALFLLLDRPSRTPTPLGWALVLFFLTQTLASLPGTSLSWRVSLWGDYENFSGWVTLATGLTLFAFYSRVLTWPLLEKALFFNSLAAILSSLYAVAQHFGLDPIHWSPGSVNASREFASLGNPNFLAAYLAMSLPLFLAGSRGKGWFLTALGTFVIAFGLLSTGSRGGFLAALAGLAFWALLVPRPPSAPATGNPRWLPWVLGASALVPLFFFHGGFWDRLLSSILHVGDSLATSRLHIWGPAWKMALAHPFTGVGLDTFKIAFPFYSGIEFNQIDGMFVSSRMAHDQFLQLASTTGFLGLASYLLVLGTAAFMGRRAFRTASPERRGWLAAILASMLAYQVQGLFSFDVAALDLLWFFLLAILQWQAWEVPTPSPQGTGQAAAWLLKPFALLVLLGGLIFPLTRLGADVAFGRASVSARLAGSNGEDALSFSDYEILMMKKAVALFPGEVKYRLYLGLAYERRARLERGGTEGLSLALPCYERTIEMSPSNAYYYNNLGRVHSALGADHAPQAEKAYGEAVRLDPVNPYFLLSWAGALERTQQQTLAQKAMERAFRLDADFSAKVLSQMAFEDYRQGNKDRAFRQFGWAIQGAPNNPEAYYGRGILYLSERKARLALEDLMKVRDLKPTPEKNPSIQHLDQLLEEAQGKGR